MVGFSSEKRPLKRPRLGPPDVYPQDPKQREDELTAVNVKQGFSHFTQISDEFGTARNINISAAKLGAFINGTIGKKCEMNTLPDTGKRRLQVNTKDHFWHVTPRHKQVLEAWMKDLAQGKALSVIGKKVPIFNKREEIFLTLSEHQVPMLRAAWFLKMTASYNSAISEAKTKKRQMPDPSQEWTISLQRCCRDLLLRLTDWYNGGSGAALPISSSSPHPQHPSQNSVTSSSTSILSSSSLDDGAVALRQWTYCMDLAHHLYEEGLLDRYDWLQWVVEMCDKCKTIEDGGWRVLIPVMLSFLPDIAQSELLSRRLATIAGRKFASLFSDQDVSSIMSPAQNSVVAPPQALLDHLQCPTHRPIVLGLASALQVITLEFPTALVYNGNPCGSSSSEPILNSNSTSSSTTNPNNTSTTKISVPPGSALDILPIQPSVLPMPPRANNPIIRQQLKVAETVIMSRSRAVEAKWSCDEWQQSSAGNTLHKVLFALDALDKHCWDKVDSSNSFDLLYSQIFPISVKTFKANGNGESGENFYVSLAEADAPTVLLLCQWAVGPQRTGEYRALAVAKLLEMRQADATSIANGGSGSSTSVNEDSPSDSKQENNICDSEPMDIDNSGGTTKEDKDENQNDDDENYSGLPIYHSLLFKFLDCDAPILNESSASSKVTFASLVHLFSALIRHEIFSHDAYLCTLVARGDLSTLSPQQMATSSSSSSSSSNMNPTSVQQAGSVATPGVCGPGSHPGSAATPASVSSVTPGTTPHHQAESDQLFPSFPRMPSEIMNKQPDYGDDHNVDDDLERILQHITAEQSNMDQVDSPKDESERKENAEKNNTQTSGTTKEVTKQSRHRLYVTHFPLPQDDTYLHEANQRHILLYGVGRARDEARHNVKKVSKDLSKLFTKKFCYDIADGSRVKKHSRNEISLESLQQRFSALPYFDQHAVTCQAAQSVFEMLSSFASGRSNYLPTVDHVAFLIDLMEISLNISGMLDGCVQMLRELIDIETQLNQRTSPIVGQFVTALQLQLIAVIRRYHCVLLLDTEMTMSVWENLVRLMRRPLSSTENTSAERCTLAYITELQNSLQIAAKLLQLLQAPVQPAEPSHGWNNSFMTSCLDNPRRKVSDSIIRQLAESPVCRYSFVCNAVLAICNEADAERLNDLASLCSDMTAACPSLAGEWLGVLQSLCSPSRHAAASYADVLSEVDVKHLSIHSSLATLTALLVARQCFSFQDFVVQAVPSLLKAWNEGRGPFDPDTEAGARLTCHLLLSLFKSQQDILSGGSSVTNGNGTSVLKLSCDKRLLSASHNSITLGAVLAVLKAMLVLADAAGSGERRREQRNLPGMNLSQSELSISHIIGMSDDPSDRNDSMRGEPRTLACFAFTALQQMCAEPWVRQRCLQNPDDLCNSDMLLDPIVSTKQAQRLLHLICYPDVPLPEEDAMRTHIPRIMDKLDQWNLREAWLALTLQNKQLTASPMEHSNWLDIVARAALDVFHLGTEEGTDALTSSATPSPAPGKSPRSGKKGGQDLLSSMVKTPPSAGNINSNVSSLNNGTGGGGSGTGSSGDNNQQESDDRTNSENGIWVPSAAWLIAPLIAKLSSAVQGRVLRHAGNVLENTLWPAKATKATTNNNSTGPNTNNNNANQVIVPNSVNGGSLHSQLPFLALILTCLRDQDEQREGLLASLLTQFTKLLTFAKDSETDGKYGKWDGALRDALRLRLSLVGGMFDAIQRSSTATAEWALTLTQLVSHGVIDLNNNSDLFPTTIDMIAALLHSTQAGEPGERVDEMKKQNLNLVKKLKKELTDRDYPSIKPLRQLLPFSKVQAEVIVTQATSIIIDSKGNRVQSSEYVDKKPGLQVWEKQRVSPWELIEGQRNPAPLSWAWFGAVKTERKPLHYEEAHRLLKFHTHSMVKPFSHYLEPVPLPPEEIDVKPEISIKGEPPDIMLMKQPDTPSSVDQSPRGLLPSMSGRNKPKETKPRKRRQTKSQAAAAAAAQQQQLNVQTPPAQPPIPNSGSPFGGTNPGQTYPPGPPPQWSYSGPNQGPQGYYAPPQGPQQQQQQRGPIKQALNTLIKTRHQAGGPQFQHQPQPPNQQPPQFQQAVGPAQQQIGPQHQILRQQLRAQTPPMQVGPGPPQQQFPPGPPQQAMNRPIYQQQQQQQQMLQSQQVPGGIPQQQQQGNMPPQQQQYYQQQQQQQQQPQGGNPNVEMGLQQINQQHGMNPQQQQMGIMGPRVPVNVEMGNFMDRQQMVPRGVSPVGGQQMVRGSFPPQNPNQMGQMNMAQNPQANYRMQQPQQQGQMMNQMQGGQMQMQSGPVGNQMQTQQGQAPPGQMIRGQMPSGVVRQQMLAQMQQQRMAMGPRQTGQQHYPNQPGGY